MSTTERFAQTGQSQVISLQATTQRPPSAMVSVAPNPIPLASELDSEMDRMVDVDPIESRTFVDSRDRPQANDSPRLESPSAMPELPVDHEMMLKRRPLTEVTPTVTVDQAIRSITKPNPIGEPPTATTIPIEQFVGLQEESVADLSDNQPPEYPIEAVRQRLEGVVLCATADFAFGESRERRDDQVQWASYSGCSCGQCGCDLEGNSGETLGTRRRLG